MSRPLWAILIATSLAAVGLMRIGIGTLLYVREADPTVLWTHIAQAVVFVLVAFAIWWWAGPEGSER